MRLGPILDADGQAARTRIAVETHILEGKDHRPLRCLFDSGCEINLINDDLVHSLNLQVADSVPKPEARFLDDNSLRIYDSYLLTTRTRDSKGALRTVGTVRFWSARFVGYECVLGYPWLAAADPDIHYPTATFEWREDTADSPLTLCTAGELQEDLEVDEMICSIAAMRLADDSHANNTPGNAMHPDRVSQLRTVIAAVQSQPEAPILPEQYREYLDVFSIENAGILPPNTEFDHAIDLEEGKVPPNLPIYNLSQKELEVLRKYLDSALVKGWIQESKSPAGAPILFVPKKDGTIRLCVDYRGLNTITIKNRHPLPLISEMLDRFSHAIIFTKLDLKDAYHRLRIKKGDEWKTAFKTRYGHFEYMVMPFGLANAPATFQAYINRALGGLVDSICVVYLDDILIYSRNTDAHVEHVKRVLECLRQWSLYANPLKCEFHTDSVEFLGYIVTPNGVVMDANRVRTISEWPLPESYRDIQVFLGFTGFYRRFVWGYSVIARPLNDLLKKALSQSTSGPGKKTKKDYQMRGIPWYLTTEAEHAFRTLIAAFQDAPILAHFDPALPIMVITDASDFAYAGILLQPRWEIAGDDKSKHWHPVAFHSKSFSDTEIRYDTHDKELHAIDTCFKAWRHYLEGAAHPIQVFSDHNNLKYFMTTKTLSGRQGRYAERLAAYDFEIMHKPGISNPADGLSRRPDYAVGFKGQLQTSVLSGMLPTLQEKIRYKERASPQGADTAISPPAACESHAESGPSRGADHSSTGPVQMQDLASQRSKIFSTEGEPKGKGSREHPTALCYVLRAEVVAATQLETAYEEPASELMSKLREYQQQDPTIGAIREQLETGTKSVESKGFSLGSDGILRKKGKVWVPCCPPLRMELLRRNHDDPAAGHFGVKKTREVISRKYAWSELGKDVQNYVAECDLCQRHKSHRHKPYGMLQPLPVPTQAWRHYSLDFITDLPPTIVEGHAYDAVIVLVDRMTKFAQYFPTRKTCDSRALAELLYSSVFLVQGPPDSLVSDRGTVFTSEYWSTFCYHLRIQKRLSTAFHPQTDGQTERQNQELEAYLRMFVGWEQDDWGSLLAVAQFAYNSKRHSSTGVSPIELAYGTPPRIPDGIRDESPTEGAPAEPDAEKCLQNMRLAREAAAQALEKAQVTQAKNYNAKRSDFQIKQGDLVLLSSKNIRTKRPHKKLDAKYLGPFPIEEQIGPQAFRLKLPPGMSRLHPVFNVALLEPYTLREGFMPPPVDELEDPDVWEVELIVSHRRRPGKATEYLIKWVGWSHDHNQWMVSAELEGCAELLQEYGEKHRMERLPESVPAPTSHAKRRRIDGAPLKDTSRPKGRPKGSKNKKK